MVFIKFGKSFMSSELSPVLILSGVLLLILGYCSISTEIRSDRPKTYEVVTVTQAMIDEAKRKGSTEFHGLVFTYTPLGVVISSKTRDGSLHTPAALLKEGDTLVLQEPIAYNTR